MNIITFTKQRFTARFFAAVTVLSLVLSAFPASFFVAFAATSILGPANAALTQASPRHDSSSVDAASHTNLVLSFDYNAELIDSGDKFTYGWRSVSVDNELGFVNGKNETGQNPATDETGSILINLPLEAQAADLQIYFEMTANAEDDEVSITNYQVTGDVAEPPAEELNPNITLCHATEADANPYIVNTVDAKSIVNLPNGHDDHIDGGLDDLGDIIPPFDYNFDGGAIEHYDGKNWTTLYSNGLTGEQIYNQGGCDGEPVVEECPLGYTGTFPDCVPPVEVCPEGTVGEYPACEPIGTDKEVITACKYDGQENPIAGWHITFTNGDESYIKEPGPLGCADVAVDPENGPWKVIEEVRDNWYQVDVSATFGDVEEYEQAEICTFFNEEITEIPENQILSISDVVIEEPEYRCVFINREVEVEQCEAGEHIGAATVLEANQGTLKNGNPITQAERIDPAAALGQPDWVSGGGTGFFSIGFGGSITLAFTQFALEVPGTDITIYEATNGTTYPVEQATVEVSQDGTTWFVAGVANNPAPNRISFIDFAGTGLTWIKYVRLTDTTNPALHVALADGFDLDAVVITEGVCEEPHPKAEVTICKFDPDQHPLSGWQLSLLGQKLEDINVPANLVAGLDTTTILQAGQSYVAKAQGTWNNNRTPLNTVDAEYSTEDGWSTHMDGFIGFQTDILELQINQAFDPNSNWGPYNSLHRYMQGFVPSTTGSANFRIFDGSGTTPQPDWYNDNTGVIGVDLFEGYTGVTGENGCVTFNNVPYGEYRVNEILQDGWENVSGLKQVNVNEPHKRFKVVNRNITEAPTFNLVADKIVCSDEEDLPDWNNNADGAPDITNETAADWVAEHESCRLAAGWEFEWALPDNTNPDSNLPDSPFYGTASGNWHLFGETNADGRTTTEISLAQLGEAGHLWVREVLKDGYIPFTYGPGNLTNDDDVTAELYCHTDGKNYDNFDRVDGISDDQTYHCVAWNVPIEPEVDRCTLEIVSDETTLVFETNGFPVHANEHEAWTADITDATWIWPTEYIEDPEVDTTFNFIETFTVNDPLVALLDVAADNSYRVYVNDSLALDRSDVENNFQAHTQKDDVDILPFLFENAENTLRIEVTNLGVDGANQVQNPAGLLFRLDVTGEVGCEVTTAPEPENETYLLDGYKYEVVTDADPTPVAGWTIYATDGEEVLSTTTDQTGHYSFEVTAGDWKVYEALPEHWFQDDVQQNGSSVELDSDELYCLFEISSESESDDYQCDFYNFFDESIIDEEPETPGTQSGGGGGRRSHGSSGGDNDGNDTPAPTPLVLGEQVSLVPFGGANTGTGSDDTAAVFTLLVILLAALTVRTRTENA